MEHLSTIDWQTAGYENQDQYSAWCSALNTHFGYWVPDKIDGNQFYANASINQIGNAQFVACICDPCSASRLMLHAIQTDLQSVTFQLVLAGEEQFQIGDNKYTLTTGEILIWNDTESMRFEVISRLQKFQ